MILSEPNQINNLTLEQLSSEDIFQQIKNWAEKFCEAGIFDSDAVQLRRALEAKLNLPIASLELKTKFAPLLLIYHFTGLLNEGVEGRLELIKNHLLKALRENILVKDLWDGYFLASYDSLANHQERQMTLHALRENQEMLAQQSIKNWLGSYVVSTGAGGKRGAVERLNFVNNDPGAKGLTLKEKDILVKVLDFFDFLEYPDEEKEKENWDMVVLDSQGEELMMKMSEFNDLKRGKKVAAVIGSGSAAAIQKMSEMSAKIFDFVASNRPGLSEFGTYLRNKFPELVDAFPFVLKILNELKRRGYPQYLEVVYFDLEVKEFKWKI